MDRDHYDDDHLAFGEAVRAFLDKEVVPHFADWERDGAAPRELFRYAGDNGFLGMAVPEEYGGGGVEDFRFNQIMDEQIAGSGVGGAGLGLSLHNDTCLPYFLSYANEEQRQRWLPGIVSGELITAVAMTEPGAGSDLAGIRTSARRSDDGDGYVVNGAKTFITNGINADLVITAVRTGPDRHHGLSLMILERGMAGLRARPQPGQARSAFPGHGRTLVHRRACARGQPARPGERGIPATGAQAPPGTHVDRRRRAGRGPLRVRPRAGLRARAQSLRRHYRLVPEHPLRAGRDRHRARPHPDVPRPVRRPAQRRAS